jgi:DNA-binding MarR family transcriptional regulator
MNDPLRNYPGYALRRASAARLADFGQRLAPLGLTFTEASVLMVIAANPGTMLSAMGRILDIQRANMTPLVARLEARGLIDRALIDGRTHGLTLSPQGNALQHQVADVVAAHESALLALVPEPLRPALLPVLHALWAE